jgi:ubiquinone/menaquinone biosynthesis C-methylase UbiE
MTMAEDHYFASSTGDDLVLERIHCLEKMLDRVTISRFERIGVAAGWCCLEVAAGGGSIAAWLGDRVGAGGSVLATDMNTRFLADLNPPVQVRTLNLLTDDIVPNTFDLVHGRAILMHLREPEAALAKMAKAVKPGGWILLEEGDYEIFSALDGDHSEAQAFTDQWQAAFTKMREAGVMDAWFGRRVRQLVEELELEHSVGDGVTDIWRGREPGARFYELSSAQLRAVGFFNDEEHARNERLLNDPSFFFKDKVLFGAWGRQPS